MLQQQQHTSAGLKHLLQPNSQGWQEKEQFSSSFLTKPPIFLPGKAIKVWEMLFWAVEHSKGCPPVPQAAAPAWAGRALPSGVSRRIVLWADPTVWTTANREFCFSAMLR